MPPAKKPVTKKKVKNNSNPYFSYKYAIWIVIGVTIGVLASKYVKNQNTAVTTTSAPETKRYQDLPPPVPVAQDNTSQKLAELRSKADGYISSLNKNFSDDISKKLLAIYAEILVQYSSAWDWWRISDTEWLIQSTWTPHKVAAAKIFLDYGQDVEKAYQIFDEVAHDPNTEANHYNVALDYITQYFLKKGKRQESIYWFKFAIQLRKDDSTLARWYSFLLQELVTDQQLDQAKKQAIRCIKDFEKTPSNFPFGCYFELGMVTLFEGDYNQANKYFTELYAGGLKSYYKNEFNGECYSKELVQISLDSVTTTQRDALGKTLIAGSKLMEPFKAFSHHTCSTQKWPLYLTEELEEDPNPVILQESDEEETKLRRVAKHQEGRTLKMRCYSTFQKLPIIYYVEDVLLQGPGKSILETFENRTACNLLVPSYPYINSLAFPRYFGLNTYRYENLPVYNIEKAFIPTFLDNNYYHFLLEALPSILMFTQTPEFDQDVKIIMNLSKFGSEIIHLLGLEEFLLPYDPSTYRYHIKQAYIPDLYFTDSENALNAPHDSEEYYVPPLPIIHAVRDKIYSFGHIRPDPAKQKLVIFVHRDDEAIRGIPGSDRLYGYLEGIVELFGYQFVVHGKSGSFSSISKQAEQFSRAAIVIGVHGAGLTNILFCSPGASVIELPVYPEKVSVYSRLASSLNLPYYTVPSFATFHFSKVEVLSQRMVYDLRDTIEYILGAHIKNQQQ